MSMSMYDPKPFRTFQAAAARRRAAEQDLRSALDAHARDADPGAVAMAKRRLEAAQLEAERAAYRAGLRGTDPDARRPAAVALAAYRAGRGAAVAFIALVLAAPATGTIDQAGGGLRADPACSGRRCDPEPLPPCIPGWQC
jgi:hypothetical protein